MKISATKTLLTVAIASAPLLANAVQLEDYLVANSSYDEAYVSGSLSGIEPARDNDNDQFYYNYSIDADYSRTFNTLPRNWNYSLGLNAKGDKPQARTITELDENDELVTRDTESTDNWTFEAGGNVDTYFHQSSYPKAFWFGKGKYKHQDNQNDDDISATVGLGYGRVYNATPLAQVIRIVEELNEDGLLTGPIPDSVALETAEIVDRKEEFESKFGEDDYRPDYYAAIEAALARSGALRDGKLGAMGALTADNVLEEEKISTRKHGWVIRLGAGFQASDLSGIADNDPKLVFEWEYAKPQGYKGQFINSLVYEPVFGDNTIQKVTNEMSYTYEVSDMIDWENRWTVDFSDSGNVNGEDWTDTTHTLSTRYAFDLGNSLDYFVGLSISQEDTEPNSRNQDSELYGDDPKIEFNSGFNYRLK